MGNTRTSHSRGPSNCLFLFSWCHCDDDAPPQQEAHAVCPVRPRPSLQHIVYFNFIFSVRSDVGCSQGWLCLYTPHGTFQQEAGFGRTRRRHMLSLPVKLTFSSPRYMPPSQLAWKLALH